MNTVADTSTAAQALAPGRARAVFFAKLIGLGMAAALAFAFFMGHYLHKGYPAASFLFSSHDVFMDFFNVNADAYDFNPYPTKIPYPPFSMLLARGFATGFDYAAHGPFVAQGSFAGRFSYFLMASAFCAFFFASTYRAVQTGDRARDLQLALVLGFNYPVLFLIDRGNYVMVAFVFLFGFIYYYDRKRMLSNLFLALAVSMKPHPALFLLLLAADRRWRDLAVVVGLTVVINLTAMLFFQGGPVINTVLFVENLFLFNAGFHDKVADAAWNLSFSNLLRVPYVVFLDLNPGALLRYYPWVALTLIGVLFYVLCTERTWWKRVLVVTIALVGLPNLSGDYNLVYLFIPLFLYFQEKGEMRRGDYFFLACLAVLFAPKNYYVLAATLEYVLTPQAFLNPLLLLALFLWVAAPRAVKPVLWAGGLVLLVGVVYCVETARAVPEFAPEGLAMKGNQGPWLLRQGSSVTAPTDLLLARPVIALRGIDAVAKRGRKLPGVAGVLIVPGLRLRDVPVSLVKANDEEYLLTINLEGQPLPPLCSAEVQLSFDSWWVPKETGESSDPRPLAIPTPFALELLPAPEAKDPAASP